MSDRERHPTESVGRAPQMRQRFRSDIQALRALAVAAVVGYHLWPTVLPGGFVGVDVFFVISGFLITRHLSIELEATGRIRLVQFWVRRIRRLLPAALTVLCVSLLILALLLPSVSWQQNISEIKASALYSENWRLAFDAVDYLAADNQPSLVQHYWSLSAEEQFYLAWPFVLLLSAAVLVKLPGRQAMHATNPDRIRLRTTVTALAVVALASFALSVTMTVSRPAMAFFATPTRAWEFAVGGIISSLRPNAAPRAIRAAAAWLGVVFLFVTFFALPPSIAFPGWVVVIPVASAALVIAFGLNGGTWSVASLTRSRPLQWIGDHSYSLYLWHWPLIVALPAILARPVSNPERAGILVLALLLTALSKRYIEDPLRRGFPQVKRSRIRPHSRVLIVTGVTMLALVGIVTVWSDDMDRQHRRAASAGMELITAETPCFGARAIVDSGCNAPFVEHPSSDPAFARADTDPGLNACQTSQTADDLTLCAFGDTQHATTTVAVIGNSHAVRLVPALDTYGRAHHWRILLAAKTSCLGLVKQPVSEGAPTKSCLSWSSALQSQLLSMPKLDAAIFASHIQSEDYLAGSNASASSLATAQHEIETFWSSLRSRGVRVIVTEDVPGMRPDDDPVCVAISRDVDDPCAVPRPQVVLPNFLESLAQQDPELARYVTLSQYFCDADLCHAIIGGVIVYSDSHHMTSTYSRSLAKYLGPQVARALL